MYRSNGPKGELIVLGGKIFVVMVDNRVITSDELERSNRVIKQCATQM